MSEEIGEICVRMVEKVTSCKPLVMCITNLVTPQRVADLLLATGASPIMIENANESVAIASISSAVYINMGLHGGQISSIKTIKEWKENDNIGEKEKVVPIVVDPVGYGASVYRNEVINEFLLDKKGKESLGCIKGNASEITTLAKLLGGYNEEEEKEKVSTSTTPSSIAISNSEEHKKEERKNQGVDSEGNTFPAIAAGKHLAKFLQTIVSISGDHDIIISACGTKVTRIRGDNPMMARFTGSGCALGAVVAAFLGVTSSSSSSSGSENGDRYEAVVCAHYLYTAASMLAKSQPQVQGPGSLSIALADTLFYLSEHPIQMASYASLEQI